MKVFVGICNTQDIVPSGFFWSFVRIKHVCPMMIFRAVHAWDVVRNNDIIKTFLDSDCDILAKMDIDQMYPLDYFERLIPLCLEHKVAGPLILDRWEQNEYMPLAFDKVNKDKFPVHKMNLSCLEGQVVPVPFPHTNLLYHREVLEKIPPPWYEAYLTPDGLERANHVDYSFIEKIRLAGYGVMIDLGCKVGHMETRFV